MIFRQFFPDFCMGRQSSGHLAEVTVEWGTGDDGRGHDDEAKHDEAVDEEVFKAVPPATVRGETSSLARDDTELQRGHGHSSRGSMVQCWLRLKLLEFSV